MPRSTCARVSGTVVGFWARAVCGRDSVGESRRPKAWPAVVSAIVAFSAGACGGGSEQSLGASSPRVPDTQLSAVERAMSKVALGMDRAEMQRLMPSIDGYLSETYGIVQYRVSRDWRISAVFYEGRLADFPSLDYVPRLQGRARVYRSAAMLRSLNDGSLAEVVGLLASIAATENWTDDTHLDRWSGSAVFDQMRTATAKLTHIQRPEASEGVVSLVVAARAVAETAATDAPSGTTRGENARALQDAAQRAFAQREYETAVELYGMAWAAAVTGE